MTQRILRLNSTQIVSGTERMTPGEGGTHTRQLWASVPRFSSRPDIAITIYSPEDGSIFFEEGDVGNPGTTFTQWAIEYVPEGGVAGWDLIAISATNNNIGAASDCLFVCSYVAIGEE